MRQTDSKKTIAARLMVRNGPAFMRCAQHHSPLICWMRVARVASTKTISIITAKAIWNSNAAFDINNTVAYVHLNTVLCVVRCLLVWRNTDHLSRALSLAIMRYELIYQSVMSKSLLFNGLLFITVMHLRTDAGHYYVVNFGGATSGYKHQAGTKNKEFYGATSETGLRCVGATPFLVDSTIPREAESLIYYFHAFRFHKRSRYARCGTSVMERTDGFKFQVSRRTAL